MDRRGKRGVSPEEEDTRDGLFPTPDTRRHSIESGFAPSQSPGDMRQEKRLRMDGPDICEETPPRGRGGALPTSGRLFNDAVHGHIEVDPLCVAIIDTEQFQRLRRLKQLGMASHVFPSACHHRFEHSIGTSYLAGLMVERLRDVQPELGITDVDVLCIKVAGLCHDLGHGPFSHTFELHVNAVRESGTPVWEHEMASKMMFRHMLADKDLTGQFTARGLGDRDLQFIEELIAGVSPTNWADPKTAPIGRSKDKSFLYEIVANKRNGVDVDKWDYFCRDSNHLNIKAPFDYRRYLLSARAFPASDGLWQICPRDKEVESVYELWNTRSRLHRSAYQHKTVKVLERMLLEVLSKAEPFVRIPGTGGAMLSMSEAVYDPVAYTKLTDDVLLLIEIGVDPRLKPAQEVLTDIRRRRLYKFVGKALPGANGDPSRLQSSQLPQVRKEIADCISPSDAAVVKEGDIVLDVINITHGPGKKDPIEALRFWSKDDPHRIFKIRPEEVNHVLGQGGEESRLCVYCRKRDLTSKSVLAEAFSVWCSKVQYECQASVLEPSTPMRALLPENGAHEKSGPIPFDPNA